MKRMNYCTLNNMDKSQNHAEWKDPDKKEGLLYDDSIV